MRTIITVLFLLLGTAAYEQAPFDYKRDFKPFLEQSQDKSSPLYYQKLLIRFLNNDSTLSNAETLALMIGYTEEPHYKPFEDMDAEKEVFDLNEEGNYDSALVKAKIYLQKHPLSLRVLKEASYCYHSQKKQDSADYYMDLVDKVMNAMTYSGNGKKPETPMFSLGLADGEYFIPNIGMKVLGKDTDWNKDNLFMEIIDASKSGDDHINYYFVIQHAKEKIDDDKVNDSVEKKKKKDDRKKKDKKDKKDKATPPPVQQ
ncbi:MAG: DUF4919 domain-containing protein [Chitinophagaceae bacterium]|nr:DUF4919 domain-containing protein [Chitinophagaceae bacterium]